MLLIGSDEACLRKSESTLTKRGDGSGRGQEPGGY